MASSRTKTLSQSFKVEPWLPHFSNPKSVGLTPSSPVTWLNALPSHAVKFWGEDCTGRISLHLVAFQHLRLGASSSRDKLNNIKMFHLAQTMSAHQWLVYQTAGWNLCSSYLCSMRWLKSCVWKNLLRKAWSCGGRLFRKPAQPSTVQIRCKSLLKSVKTSICDVLTFRTDLATGRQRLVDLLQLSSQKWWKDSDKIQPAENADSVQKYMIQITNLGGQRAARYLLTSVMVPSSTAEEIYWKTEKQEVELSQNDNVQWHCQKTLKIISTGSIEKDARLQAREKEK